MGIMDKIKNMFTEEVEEDEKPIKKDVIQVEIPAAKSEQPSRVESVERNLTVEHHEPETPELPKREEKFVFPVYFDDKDFDELEKPKEKPKDNIVKEPYGGNKQQPKETKKKFQPSPVISPVYGILDKNYSKDSIVTKKATSSEFKSRRTNPLTVDDVRRKAFGNLEEDLEKTLTSDNKQSFFLSEDDEIKQEVDIIDELDLKAEVFENDNAIEEMIEDHENITENEHQDNNDASADNMIEEELNRIDEDKKDDKLVESDLFNLIDSMYRGKEE